MYLSLRDDKLALKECERLAKHNIPALACPLFQLVKQDIDLSAYDKIDAFILTSQKAAHALPAHLTDVPVYVVGRASAAIIRQKGFHNIIAGPDDGKALAQIIKDDFANKTLSGKTASLLWLRGKDISFDMAAALQNSMIQLSSVICYQMQAISHLPPLVTDALASGKITGVMALSKGQLAQFEELLSRQKLWQIHKQLVLFAISDAIADEAHLSQWHKIMTARRKRAVSVRAQVACYHRQKAERDGS